MINIMKKVFTILFLFVCKVNFMFAENGYDLWLCYKKIGKASLFGIYREKNSSLCRLNRMTVGDHYPQYEGL